MAPRQTSTVVHYIADGGVRVRAVMEVWMPEDALSLRPTEIDLTGFAAMTGDMVREAVTHIVTQIVPTPVEEN